MKMSRILLFEVCGSLTLPNILDSDKNFNIRCLFFNRFWWCFVLGPCFVVRFLVSIRVEQSSSLVQEDRFGCSSLIVCAVCVCVFSSLI